MWQSRCFVHMIHFTVKVHIQAALMPSCGTQNHNRTLASVTEQTADTVLTMKDPSVSVSTTGLCVFFFQPVNWDRCLIDSLRPETVS